MGDALRGKRHFSRQGAGFANRRHRRHMPQACRQLWHWPAGQAASRAGIGLQGSDQTSWSGIRLHRVARVIVAMAQLALRGDGVTDNLFQYFQFGETALLLAIP